GPAHINLERVRRTLTLFACGLREAAHWDRIPTELLGSSCRELAGRACLKSRKKRTRACRQLIVTRIGRMSTPRRARRKSAGSKSARQCLLNLSQLLELRTDLPSWTLAVALPALWTRCWMLAIAI